MNTQSSVSRIFLIDDHPLVRMGLAQILSTQEDLEVCGEIGHGRGAAQAVEAAAPDLIILDLTLPDAGGLDLIKAIRAVGVTKPILINSMHPETLYAERVLRAGADGYLMKQVAPKKVLTAVRKVLAGEVYLSEEMTRQLVNSMGGTRRTPQNHSVERLSDREFEVFEQIGRGRSTAEIASLLGISPRTVDVHRANIKSKLGLSNSAELARMAVNWVESSAAEV